MSKYAKIGSVNLR